MEGEDPAPGLMPAPELAAQPISVEGGDPVPEPRRAPEQANQPISVSVPRWTTKPGKYISTN